MDPKCDEKSAKNILEHYGINTLVEDKQKELIQKSSDLSRKLLEDTLKKLENSPDINLKIPEILIVTPRKDGLYDSLLIEYFRDGACDIKEKKELDMGSIRKTTKGIFSEENVPFIVFVEDYTNLTDVYKEKILKFRPFALEYWKGIKEDEKKEEGNKLHGELENLEAVLEEVEFTKPELIIVVNYDFGGREKTYYMIHVAYLKRWADLGYKEENIKKWAHINDIKDFIDIDSVEEMVKKYYENSQKFPPIILGNSVKSSKNVEEDIVKSYETKILKFRRHAIEYWIKHQI